VKHILKRLEIRLFQCCVLLPAWLPCSDINMCLHSITCKRPKLLSYTCCSKSDMWIREAVLTDGTVRSPASQLLCVRALRYAYAWTEEAEWLPVSPPFSYRAATCTRYRTTHTWAGWNNLADRTVELAYNRNHELRFSTCFQRNFVDGS
jgi:hypothetical protein